MKESDKTKDEVLKSLWESLKYLSRSEYRELAERMLCPRQKTDMELVMELQRKYDELQEDCKTLVNFIINVRNGEPEPFLFEYNDRAGFPRLCYDLIREHATWSKEPINKD